METKKIKHKSHWSKYGYKQFVIPNKEEVEVLYEGNIDLIPEDILELAKISREILIENKVKFINIWL